MIPETDSMRQKRSDPRNRSDHCYRHSRSDWQRGSLQEGPRILSLAGSGARRAFHRRQAKADRYQQTRKQIPAQTLRARSAHCSAAENQAIFRPEYVAGQSHITQEQAGGDSGISQQDGAHGLGGSVQRRSLSPAAITTNSCSLMACN